MAVDILAKIYSKSIEIMFLALPALGRGNGWCEPTLDTGKVTSVKCSDRFLNPASAAVA